MLTHPGRPFERALHSSERRDPAEAAAADSRLANIKQFCVCAFSVLLAMGALAGIIALKAAFFLSRLKAQAREKLEAALAAYDKMLDTFVHHPMPPAAVEVGQVATRLVPGAASKMKKTP